MGAKITFNYFQVKTTSRCIIFHNFEVDNSIIRYSVFGFINTYIPTYIYIRDTRKTNFSIYLQVLLNLK